MLQGLLAPFLLAASVAVGAAVPPPEQCETEMNKVKDMLQVSCVDKGLTSIPTGLPEATGILLLASNRLAKVDLASFQHLPQLSELDLSNNSLKALETGADLPKLEQLILSHNGLESLPAFPGMPNLKRLALGHNQLSQLPEGGFRDLGQLGELELQGNQLQSLPSRAFEGLEMLKDLDLSDNRLELLPPELLGELLELSILRLERNRLERLPEGFFSDETVYVYVYLVGNPWLCDCRLVYLRDWIIVNEYAVYTRTMVKENGFDKEVTDNEPLSVLCQAPPKEKGRPVMSFQAACRKLGDDDQEAEEEGEPVGDSRTPSPTPSPLMAITPQTPRLSSHSPSTAVSLMGAALTTTTSALSSSTTHSSTTTSPGPTTTHVLTTTAAVVTSSLSTSGATAGRSTPTSHVPTTTPEPSTAHVTPTLRCETEMNKVKDMLQVNCVDKGLTSIPTGLPEATGILLLASNQLAKVDLASFQHLPQLSELDLSNNSLKALETGSDLPKLEQLILSHNGLESLPAFSGMPNLKRLALGHNQLSQLPEGGFRGLGQLGELELQGNQMQSLPSRAFEGLEMLKDLDLSDNRLELLPPELLGELLELSILRLERNRLERLPEGFFSDEAVYVYVYLVGNPWLCDCRLVYLRDWIIVNEHAVYTRTMVQENGFEKEDTDNEPHSVLCQAPPKEKGRPVMSFQAACRKLGDDDQEAPMGDSRTPSPTPSPLRATTPQTPRLSSHSPNRAADVTPTSPSSVPTTTATSCTPLAHSPTASMPPTSPLSSSAPMITTAKHPPSPAAPTSPTHVQSSPRILAPLSTRGFSPPLAPKPSAHCLCPALPVRVLGVAARKGSNAGRLAGWCCLLRLGLYLACLVLVALPTLGLLCWLGWLHLRWFRPALRGAPWSRLARPQEWPKASPKEWRMKFAEAPRPTSGPRIYRVCKSFQVAPSRHVTWLLVSLPGSGGKWAQMQARLSSYSLDRGQDTLGAVRVKYSAASL